MTDEVVVITCPVCGDLVEDEPRCCPRCDTPHHQDCWDYTGGCAIFGCVPREHRRVPVAAAAATTPIEEIARPVRRWLWLHRLEGWGKALAAIDLVLLVGILPATSLVTAVFSETMAKWFFAGFVATGTVGLFGIYVLLVYFALLFPFRWFSERSLSDRFGSRGNLIAPSAPSREVIDRLDPLPVDRAVLYVMRTFGLFVKFLAIFSLLYVVAAFFVLTPSLELMAAIGFLLMGLIVVPTVEQDFKERVAVSTAIQNRLIASLKKDR